MYYKIVQDGIVIGVGKTFLKWFPSKRRNMYCEIDVAERAQDVITGTLYHDDWLRNPPPEADSVSEASIIKITAIEYDELYEQLSDGEEVPDIPEPDPEPEPTPEPDPEPEPERTMTVQEMRDKIKEQEEMIAVQNEQLQMLTECILEMSEVVYGE